MMAVQNRNIKSQITLGCIYITAQHLVWEFLYVITDGNQRTSQYDTLKPRNEFCATFLGYVENLISFLNLKVTSKIGSWRTKHQDNVKIIFIGRRYKRARQILGKLFGTLVLFIFFLHYSQGRRRTCIWVQWVTKCITIAPFTGCLLELKRSL